MTGRRAFYRLGIKPVPRSLQITLGTGAKQIAVLKPVKTGEWIGRSLTKGQPGVKRIKIRRLRKKLLAEIDLVAVPPPDMTLQIAHPLAVLRRREAGRKSGN